MSARAAQRVGRVGRYLLPRGDRAVVSYFLEHLFVGHGRRERMVGRVLARLGGRGSSRLLLGKPPRRAEARAGGQGDALDSLEMLADAGHGLLAATGIGPDALRRSIVLLDHAGSRRRRLVVFPFRPGEDRPAAVLKLRPLDAGGLPLEREWSALRQVGDGLAPELGATAPRPLAFGVVGEVEVLAASHLGGTSAYVEMNARPRPEHAAERHLRAAADWLAAFHRATRVPGGTFAPGEEAAGLARLAGDGATPDWLRALERRSAASPIPLCAGHGDFWARNLLLPPADLAGTPCGVVDWEHFAPEAAPQEDLFHFPLTYGINFPWPRQGRRDALPEAFRLAFLRETPVSRAVHRYLLRYCARVGLEPELLRPLLRLELLRRARSAGPLDRSGWLACERLLAAGSSFPLRDHAPSVAAE